MKAILYFVAAGIVLPRHSDAAQAIAKQTGKRVVFRNAHTADGEKPESNEGVAGKVPESYASFTHYSDIGSQTKEAEPANAFAPASERKLNALGVPDEDGAPTDREGLKAVLEAEEIQFHGNAKTEALVDLYNAHFYPEG